MPDGLRVVLAAPSDATRAAIRGMVEERWGWQVVGEVSDLRRSVPRARELRPDVVLLVAPTGAPEVDEVTAMLEAISVVPVLLLEAPAEHCYSGGPAVLRAPTTRMRRVIVDRSPRFEPMADEGERA